MTFLDDRSPEFHAWNAARIILKKLKSNVDTDHFFTDTSVQIRHLQIHF